MVALNQQTGNVRSYIPKNGTFVFWAQRAAIMKASKRPNAAKLYMSWNLDAQTQSTLVLPGRWSVRQDLPNPTGARSIYDYPGQMSPNEFHEFMSDRATVEKIKTQMRFYVGEPQGPSPPGELGPYPDKMLPGSYP